MSRLTLKFYPLSLSKNNELRIISALLAYIYANAGSF